MVDRNENIDREAEEFRTRYAATLAKRGVKGEYFCDSQREQWLDELRDAYKDAITGNVPTSLRPKKPPALNP